MANPIDDMKMDTMRIPTISIICALNFSPKKAPTGCENAAITLIVAAMNAAVPFWSENSVATSGKRGTRNVVNQSTVK